MKLLQAQHVQVLTAPSSWEEAIKLSVKPLEKNGYVNETYGSAIINKVKELGPYICLAPHICMPHARPEDGVNDSQIAVTLFTKEVPFNEEKSAALFITLAAADSEKHMETLMTVAELLQDQNKVNAILACKTADEVYEQFL